jgi:hypothetical protein
MRSPPYPQAATTSIHKQLESNDNRVAELLCAVTFRKGLAEKVAEKGKGVRNLFSRIELEMPRRRR